MRPSDLVYLPPHAMAERFASPVLDEEAGDDAPDVESVDYDRDVAPALDYLRPREADVVELYFQRRLRQWEIAKLLGISQPAVSFALHRALRRAKFISEIAHVTHEKASSDLAGLLSPTEIAILLVMGRVPDGRSARRLLGLTRGVVRYRWARIKRAIVSAEGEQFAVYKRLVAAAPSKERKR